MMTNEIERGESNLLKFEQKDKIKLTKNSKGTNWEISILKNTTKAELDEMIANAEYVNNELINRFGDS